MDSSRTVHYQFWGYLDNNLKLVIRQYRAWSERLTSPFKTFSRLKVNCKRQQSACYTMLDEKKRDRQRERESVCVCVTLGVEGIAAC